MNRLGLLTILILLTSRLFIQCATPQNPGRTGFQTDYSLFTQILKQAHAGIDKYHSARQVDSEVPPISGGGQSPVWPYS